MATTAEMAPVLYDEQDVAEVLDRQQKDLARKYRRETKVKLDDLMETIKSNQAIQLGGAAVGGAALEGVVQAAGMSEPWDIGMSAAVGAVGFVGTMWLDDHPGVAAGVLGGASAAMGRATAGLVRMGVGAYRGRGGAAA